MDLHAAKPIGRSDSAVPTWKTVAAFYLIACGFSWLVWLPLILGPDGLKVLTTSFSVPVFVCIGTLGPLLGSFVAHRWDTGNWRAVRVLPRGRLPWIWLALGPLPSSDDLPALAEVTSNDLLRLLNHCTDRKSVV